MDLDILDRFTIHLRNTLSRSIDLAWEIQQERIPPLFLLVGLCEQHGSIATDILKKHRITLATLDEHLHSHAHHAAATKTPPVGFLWPEFSAHTKKVIERATAISCEFKHQYIGTEHLLLSLVEKPDALISTIFKKQQVNVAEMKKQLLGVMSGTNKLTEIQHIFSDAEQGQSVPQGQARATSPHDHAVDDTVETDTPALDYFSVDLTHEQQAHKLSPVVGREKEIDRIIHILSRRTKNNPLLIGDPGVGKTAIVEGLARRIAEGSVPDILLNKRVVALDLGLVLAGTMYRGEFESRFRQVTEELRTHPNCILFIDEIHTIIGAGGVSGGTLDAANLLKPALARGDLHCIGATTAEEFRKHIESDPAFERRFQTVQIDEPSEEHTVAMLEGLRPDLEKFHHVTISPDVLRAAAQFSARYIPDRRLPDKAIDLLDEAGAKAHVARKISPAAKKIDALRRQLAKLRKEKKAAVRSEQYSHAVQMKHREIQITQKIATLEKSSTTLLTPKTALTVYDIALVVSTSTGIPLQHILASHQQRPQNFSQQLKRHIIGQDAAVDVVASALKRAHAGLTSEHRPLASFLFLGASGVGKTALAKTVASTIFHDRKALIRLDMSEFSESFTVSKFIGAPAGYVGHKEGMKFIDQIRRKPYSVVLFDEIEKAHPDMYNLLLQILDEGRLTDSTGREANFRNTVIILTSNIGIDTFTKQAELGFGSQQESPIPTDEDRDAAILSDVRNSFPAEFLNRIDHLVCFRPLTLKAVEKIVDLHWAEVQKRLATRGYVVTLTAAARTLIAKKSFKPEEGARRVAKVITDLIENPLADKLLSGHYTPGTALQITRNADTIAIVQQQRKKTAR